MKKTIFTLAFAAFASLGMLHAQTELTVNHPQQWWFWNEPSSIEEALIRVTPHGIYTEVGLFLTFDSPDFIPEGDSFEIVLKFSLPQGALVVDSWLWVGEDVVRASITDRWTASAIYEGIVDRRQDPSILTKMDDGRYLLKIYPLVADENRKVKITYLVPAQWSAEEVITTLPLHILDASELPVQQVKLRVQTDPALWGQPRLKGISGQQPAWTELAEDIWETTLPSGNSNIKLAVDAPLHEGVFVSTLPAEGPDYYQMVVIPEVMFNLEASAGQKKLIAIEFVNGNSGQLTKAAMLSEVKAQMLSTFSPNDYFNIVVTDHLATGQFTPYFFRDHWVSAHPDSIEAAFAAISGFSSTSNLPGMLSEGISFIQNNGGQGELLLFANSSQIGHFSTANPLIEAIQALMDDQVIPIHVLDFQLNSFTGYWLGNNYFRGNQYFYSNLTRVCGGSYFSQMLQCCAPFQNFVQQMVELETPSQGIIDIHTSLENGFSFQRFDFGITSGTADFNKPILQVGRLQGTGAFQIEANMEQNGVFQSNEMLFTEDLLIQADTMLREMWAGNQLAVLDYQANSNANVLAAVEFSIAERVLGKYTAFLCLEPSLGGEICDACDDDEEVVPVEPEPTLAEGPVWTAFPNPFSDQVRVDITLSEGLQPKDCSLSLFDATGRKIRQFQTTDLSGAGQDWQLIWDARDESGVSVPPGVYFLVLSTPNGQYHLKLVCVR
ncbi:MAG: T9SS type A sorting domain-containing protein [Saprospiraceae bacterium]|nr:T9SS type A sorting domain-containing protein [Saprospiraceae bacterium]